MSKSSEDGEYKRNEEYGRNGGYSSESLSSSLLGIDTRSAGERDAARRGFEAGVANKGLADAINAGRASDTGHDWSDSGSSESSTYDRIVASGVTVCAVIGAVVGLIAGLVDGFAAHGVGGALLYGLFFAAAFGICGAVIAVLVPMVVGAYVAIGIIFLVWWVFSQLWDLGKPVSQKNPVEISERSLPTRQPATGSAPPPTLGSLATPTSGVPVALNNSQTSSNSMHQESNGSAVDKSSVPIQNVIAPPADGETIPCILPSGAEVKTSRDECRYRSGVIFTDQ